MGSTLKYSSQEWSDESGDSWLGDGRSSDEKRPSKATAAEDVFDDPSILDELAEANASLTARSYSVPALPLPTRLPPVDAFDLDEAFRTSEFEEASLAKSLAHRLGPPGHDETESPRRRKGLGKFGRRQPVLTTAEPRGSRRAFFWGFCTSLAIIIAVPAVFGFVLPLSSSPPTADVAEVADAGPADEPATAAVMEVAAAERPTNETIAIRKQPVAAGIIAPTTTAFAAPLAQPRTPEDGFRLATAPAETPAEAPAPVIDLNAPATEPQAVEPQAVETEATEPEVVETVPTDTISEPEGSAVDSVSTEPVSATEPAAAEIAPLVAEPEAPALPAETEVAPPQTAPPPSAAAADEVDKIDRDFTRLAQSQLSATTDPSAIEAFDAAAEERPTGAEPAPSLAGEEIDRLLARGESLLRSGNIVSARMLFLHIAAAGDRRGAKAVGMTYDPDVFAQLPVTGMTPDRAQAEVWYEKAGFETTYTIDLTLPQAAPVDSEASALNERHAACARKYVSYDRNTGLYVARSGAKRQCQLP